MLAAHPSGHPTSAPRFWMTCASSLPPFLPAGVSSRASSLRHVAESAQSPIDVTTPAFRDRIPAETRALDPVNRVHVLRLRRLRVGCVLRPVPPAGEPEPGE